jgi:anti-sigma B factor antagonist
VNSTRQVIAATSSELVVTPEALPIARLELVGRVDAMSVGSWRERLRGLVAEGYNRFVLDLSRVNFLDSAGMAMVVSLMKQARLAGGDIRVVRPSDESVQRMLHLTRLDLVLNLTDDARAAMDGLRS